MEAGHGTRPADFGYLLPHAILWGQQWILPSVNPWKQHPTHLSVTISHSRSIPCLSITFTVSIILKYWLIAGSTLSYCPVLAQRLYNWLSEAYSIVGPVRIENAQGSKLSIFSMLSIYFCISARMDDRLNLPSTGKIESVPVISTTLTSFVNLMFTRSNLLILW